MYKAGDHVEFSVGGLNGSGTLLGIVNEYTEYRTWIIRFDTGMSLWYEGKESKAVVLPERCFKLVH